MMRYVLIAAMAALVLPYTLCAQEQRAGTACTSLKSRMAAKPTTIDPGEESYDVKYLKFNLAVTNLSKVLSGDVTTRAVTVAPSTSVYVFELDATLTIDSLKMNGVLSPFSTTGNLRTVPLPAALPPNTTFTAQVFYHGIPASTGTIFGGVDGYNNLNSGAWGTQVTFTQSESYHAKEWWPCKQSLRDKIDSVDMWITVANDLKAGSNGVLAGITTIDPGHVRYEWKERKPIDYYLISLAVAPYVDYSYYMHFTGSTDSMLVQNYVYNNPATLPFYKSVIDSTGMMVDYLSTLYGRYPFWQEKYGHCMAPLGGGMEHQTMTTLGYFEGSIVAHELGHQWFGDHVTCDTWADIVMNEGFAGYTEDLFIDHFRSHAKMLADMRDKQQHVLTVDTGTVYADDTVSELRIFDSRLTYDKGACVLHMLRSVVNNDSAFFAVYKAYQADYGYATGSIATFRDKTKSLLGTVVNGINIDTFFNQWAYLQGYPIYNITWNQSGSDVWIKVDQATALPASVPMFSLPVEFALHTATGDSVVRVTNTLPSEVFHFTLDRAMVAMDIDPNNWLLYKLNNLSRDPLFKVGIEQVSMAPVTVTPNPASSAWTISSLPAGSHAVLTDVSGRTVWQTTDMQPATVVPAAGLTPGMYMLKVAAPGAGSKVYKLIKQ